LAANADCAAEIQAVEMWWLICIVAIVVIWHQLRRRWRRRLTEGEAVLVTGCDSGFGLHAVKGLLEHSDATIFAGYVTQEGKERLAAMGPRVVALPMDVTKNDELKAAFEAVEKAGKPLHGIVNNAALGCYGWCEGLSLETFEKNTNVNFLGAVRVAKLALPLLRKSRGRMVTIGSLGGRMPSAFGSAYIPTKAAVGSFHHCVAQEVFQFGIRCSIIEIGFFATGLLHRAAALGEKACKEANLDGVYMSFSEKMKRSEQAVTGIEKLNGGQAGVDYVIDAIIDALSAKFPKSCYLCGWDAAILGRVGPLLPCWFMMLLQAYIV